MIPKEYAEKVIKKYYEYQPILSINECKKFAEIAIKEVIDALRENYNSTYYCHFYETSTYFFYRDALEFVRNYEHKKIVVQSNS